MLRCDSYPAPESDDDDEGGDAMMDGQTQRQLSERERAMNAGLELAFTLTIIQSSLFSATYM